MTIEALTKDLLIITFSNVDLQSIGRCARTCKWWRQITQNEKLWELFCSRVGYLKIESPPCTWKTSCKIHAGKIFSYGEASASSIQIRSWAYYFHPIIRPACVDDLLVFYKPEDDTIELWNWVNGVCLKKFRTSESGVRTPRVLPLIWEETGRLTLSGNKQKLWYTLESSRSQTATLYSWVIEGQDDLLLPKSTESTTKSSDKQRALSSAYLGSTHLTADGNSIIKKYVYSIEISGKYNYRKLNLSAKLLVDSIHSHSNSILCLGRNEAYILRFT